VKILLSGATGFTGRHFALAAQSMGHAVLPLHADLTNRAAVQKEVLTVEPDVVVHLAAISYVGHADDAAFYAVNVVGTTNLLSALTQLPEVPRCVLLASSANVYGNCKDSPISENQPPAPVNHYAASKLAMEHMARTFCEQLPIVITRPFNYTGVGHSEDFVVPKMVTHFARRSTQIALGNLHVEREYNDVRFVSNAYLKLLATGVPGEIYNVCSGQVHTLQNVQDLLTELTGHLMEISVNPDLIRANEVHRLCGDPAKLIACVGVLDQPALPDTLRWMLQAASHQDIGK
jgi:nucleoside-diphosphate-sugar epimerase